MLGSDSNIRLRLISYALHCIIHFLITQQPNRGLLTAVVLDDFCWSYDSKLTSDNLFLAEKIAFAVLFNVITSHRVKPMIHFLTM